MIRNGSYRFKGTPTITATENRHALELIERAERTTPFCACGEPMVPAGQGRQIWLVCSTQLSPSPGVVRRLLAAVGSAAHTRTLIVELPGEALAA